ADVARGRGRAMSLTGGGRVGICPKPPVPAGRSRRTDSPRRGRRLRRGRKSFLYKGSVATSATRRFTAGTSLPERHPNLGGVDRALTLRERCTVPAPCPPSPPHRLGSGPSPARRGNGNGAEHEEWRTRTSLVSTWNTSASCLPPTSRTSSVTRFCGCSRKKKPSWQCSVTRLRSGRSMFRKRKAGSPTARFCYGQHHQAPR